MAKAVIEIQKFEWKIEAKCPRCKKRITKYITTNKKYLSDSQEFTCSKCQLIFKEQVIIEWE